VGVAVEDVAAARWCCVLEPVRPITLREIREGRKRIAGPSFRTPLVRLELGARFPDIRLKLENCSRSTPTSCAEQRTRVALLSDAERGRGVWDDQRR